MMFLPKLKDWQGKDVIRSDHLIEAASSSRLSSLPSTRLFFLPFFYKDTWDKKRRTRYIKVVQIHHQERGRVVLDKRLDGVRRINRTTTFANQNRPHECHCRRPRQSRSPDCLRIKDKRTKEKERTGVGGIIIIDCGP